MQFVTDTHSLVWYLQDSAKLSTAQKSLFETGKEPIIIPAIVIAELLYITKKTKMDFLATLSHLEESATFKIHPLSTAIIKVAAAYKLLEMHDALIVATAKALSLPLMTFDKEIRKSGWVEVL